jgi:hypothetical protein
MHSFKNILREKIDLIYVRHFLDNIATVVDAIDERMADTFAEKYIERTHIHHLLDI